MRRTRKKRNSSSAKFFTTYVLLAIAAVALVFGGFSMLFPPKPTLHILAQLPIPYQPTIYLPGPYRATELPTSPVLGAETINTRDVITYINNERMKRGVPPLRENKLLAQAAQMRADVILQTQNFSHQDPYKHIQLDTVLPRVNYPFAYASENIGMGENSALAFVNGFMSSTHHRENLLNPALVETGVGLSTGAYEQYWVNVVVQIFAIPATRQRYLGYSQEDVEQYKQVLSDIESQLALTNQRLQDKVSDKDYYEGWQKILIRQREIVMTIYDGMLKDQPLVKNVVSLIQEYNNNWNRIPKNSSG